MNDELLAQVEREVLGWPGVSKETGSGGPGQGGFWVPPFTVYRFGRRALGHIHDTGVADLTFPKDIHDELISDGRAKPHGAGFAGVVSYHIREQEDVPGAVELFRMNYERLRAREGRRGDNNLVDPRITAWGNGCSCPTLRKGPIAGQPAGERRRN